MARGMAAALVKRVGWKSQRGCGVGMGSVLPQSGQRGVGGGGGGWGGGGGGGGWQGRWLGRGGGGFWTLSVPTNSPTLPALTECNHARESSRTSTGQDGTYTHSLDARMECPRNVRSW